VELLHTVHEDVVEHGNRVVIEDKPADDGVTSFCNVLQKLNTLLFESVKLAGIVLDVSVQDPIDFIH
jgi:hypothetical protein